MIRKLWPTKSAPKPAPHSPQSAKARLVLELINKKVLPRPSGHFTKELQKLAAGGAAMPEKDRQTILGSLGKHVSDYDAKPATPKRQASAPAAKPPKPVPAARPKVDISQLDKMAGLEDQHPAVIAQRLDRLDPKERRAQLARLSGETARHVSLLSWQREAATRKS